MYDAVVTDANGDTIRSASAATAVASVACGVTYTDSTGARRSGRQLPAATTYTGTNNHSSDASYVSIVDGPQDVIFKASCDEALAETDLGLNFAMLLGAAVNGYSGHELDATGRAVTATIPWRALDFVDSIVSDADAADAHLEVMLNAGLLFPVLSAYTGL